VLPHPLLPEIAILTVPSEVLLKHIKHVSPIVVQIIEALAKANL
jgi:hypothetical protein